MRLDKDFVWEGEYGRREHLCQVFKELLRKQKANALQMLALRPTRLLSVWLTQN